MQVTIFFLGHLSYQSSMSFTTDGALVLRGKKSFPLFDTYLVSHLQMLPETSTTMSVKTTILYPRSTAIKQQF
jgi:hypothetical protein